MNLDICKHPWCHHHHQSNKAYPTLPEVSCVPLFWLFVCFCGENSKRSILNKFWSARYHIQYRLCYIKYYLELEDQIMCFQILLQLIRGSSFNSWVGNEILPHVKRKKTLYLTLKFVYLLLAVLGLHFGQAFLQFQRAGPALKLQCVGFSLWWLASLVAEHGL